ncbi:LacI family DNA-binding transcriptional regulator [Glycomyces harbinensis]|uniref:LacI family transcriptional regulator n=1 Tax=Glycomyces harbinensis TaxID=58114 RepID=A0A1G7A9I9_9ACTN|nr:LacI family DNA-binding transcriptional regulator [Glycomyces harbinensis]SDE11492.1 LacI family transcriptional regulator [Glycomyces harbinensis]
MGKRVTILDVAAEAGVSRQTVTRAMNGMDDIKDSTRRRVLDAAERLGYRPSRFARNLVTRQKQHALGLVVASFDNPYYTDIAASVLAVAGERGWQVMMAAAQDDMDPVLVMLSSHVDVVVMHVGDAGAEPRGAAGGLPIVYLEAESPLPGAHSVELDIESGIVEMVAALRERGARRFGMVDSGYLRRTRGSYVPTPKRRWFEREAGEQFVGAAVGEESIAGGGRAFGELLEAHPDVDAVLVFNDLMALGAVQHARARGIDVPGAVRIVGIDGLALGEAVNPPLTSIALDSRGLAANTLDIAEILARAEFAGLDPIHRKVRSKILWRASA